jgi:hypothetical protein
MGVRAALAGLFMDGSAQKALHRKSMQGNSPIGGRRDLHFRRRAKACREAGTYPWPFGAF